MILHLQLRLKVKPFFKDILVWGYSKGLIPEIMATQKTTCPKLLKRYRNFMNKFTDGSVVGSVMVRIDCCPSLPASGKGGHK
jgi:hypothetical protein